jgi:uncharacterized membrane protein YsdA (DUF1294 family)
MKIEIFLIYLLVVNIFGFLTIGYDKYKARRKSWRIPEKRFFWIGLVGGAVGIYTGMQLFRHKTQHKKFIYGMPLLILVNLTLLGYALFMYYR